MIKKYLIAFFMTLLAVTVSAENFEFETNSIRLSIDSKGYGVSLLEKDSNIEWMSSISNSLFAVKIDSRWYPSTSIEKKEQYFEVNFGEVNVRAIYSISGHKNYIIIELIDLKGENIQAVRLLQLYTKGLSIDGKYLAVRWNDKFAVSALGLSPRVNPSLGDGNSITATVYPEFGMIGEKIALVTIPSKKFLDTVQLVERDFGLPSPQIEGQWAKTSKNVETSYLFIDLTAWNVDEVIEYAKLGNFKYILIYAKTWSSSLGSYPINRKNFPLGEKSLKSVVDKIHNAGLKVGIHTLTSFISKNDPLVHPIPDPRLLKDAEAVLARDLDSTSAEIFAAKPLVGFPSELSHYTCRGGLDIKIDNEIIQCRDSGVSNDKQLRKCKRGFAGTKPAHHRLGAKVYHLTECYGSYLADLRTSLKEQISERIAGLINRLKLDMVYFDGGQGNNNKDFAWFWGNQQIDNTLRRVQHDLLIQGAVINHWNWHWLSRGVCDDYAAIATTQYLDHHKIKRWQLYHDNFLPAELGWWAILNNAPDHMATTPEEVEYHAIRMIALNAPISLETTVDTLRTNGRINEMLRLFGKLERVRLRGDIPENIRNALRAGNWHWDEARKAFYPIQFTTRRVTLPGEIRLNTVGNLWKIRLDVLPELTKPGAKENILLYPINNSPMSLSPPIGETLIPGALIHNIAFAQDSDGNLMSYFPALDFYTKSLSNNAISFDLSNHRALAIKLNVEDSEAVKNESFPILNVQLVDSRGRYRDYYIDINFVGANTVILPNSNIEKMFLFATPSLKKYRYKSAFQGFNYKEVTAINLRWMRYPNSWSSAVELEAIEALAEKNIIVKNLNIKIGGASITSISIGTGDYIEITKDNSQIFESGGRLIRQISSGDLISMLKLNNNLLNVLSSNTVSADFLITIQSYLPTLMSGYK